MVEAFVIAQCQYRTPTGGAEIKAFSGDMANSLRHRFIQIEAAQAAGADQRLLLQIGE